MKNIEQAYLNGFCKAAEAYGYEPKGLLEKTALGWLKSVGRFAARNADDAARAASKASKATKATTAVTKVAPRGGQVIDMIETAPGKFKMGPTSTALVPAGGGALVKSKNALIPAVGSTLKSKSGLMSRYGKYMLPAALAVGGYAGYKALTGGGSEQAEQEGLGPGGTAGTYQVPGYYDDIYDFSTGTLRNNRRQVY